MEGRQMRSPVALVVLFMVVGLLMGSVMLVPAAAFALERAGTVVAVRGKVEVDRKGVRSRLRVKDPIYVVDTIYTNNGRVQLMFSDHSLVSLGRNTVLTVSEYRYRPQAGEGALKTRVTEGVFRVVGGAITRLAPENFTTETPTATIGIRGSMYSGIYRNQTLSVLFEGGRGIFVRNRFGSTDLSRPNLLTTVLPNKPPAPPKRATPADLQQFYQELAAPVTGEQEEQRATGTQTNDKKETGQASAGDDGQAEGEATASSSQGQGGEAQDAGQPETAGGATPRGGENGEGQGGPSEADVEQAVGQALGLLAGAAPESGEDAELLGALLGEGGGLAGEDAGLLPVLEDGGLSPAGSSLLDDTGVGAAGDLTDVQDVVDTVVNDAVQQQVVESVEEGVLESVGTGGGVFEGAFLSILFTPSIIGGQDLYAYWSGSASLSDAGGGQFVGEETATDGNSWPLAFDTANGVSASWPVASPWLESAFSRSVTLGGASYLLEGSVLYPASRDFFAWSDGWQNSLSMGWLENVGFVGIPTSSLPVSGVGYYEAEALSMLQYTDGASAAMTWLDVDWWVDYATGTVVGVGTSTTPELSPVIWYGHLTNGDASLGNVVCRGTGERDDNTEVLLSSFVNSGSLFGTDAVGFGWAGITKITAADGGADLGSANILLAGGRVATLSPARTGRQLRGFMSGIMGDVDPITGLPQNLVAAWDEGDLVITPDVDGSLTGSFYISDLNDSGIDTTVIMGGAAVADSLFAGETEPFPGGASSIFWTEPDMQPFPAAIWGRMTLPYQTGEGWWIASSRPDLDLSRVVTGLTGVHALFSGPARLLYSNPSISVFDAELDGTATFDFDLGGNSFAGRLDFSGQSGPVLLANGSLYGAGFSGTSIQDENGTSFVDAGIWGRIAGSDTTDAVLLGSFYAKESGATGALYTGIFGGALDKTTSGTTSASSQQGAFLSVLFDTSNGDLLEAWFGTVAVDDSDGDGVFTGEMRDSVTSSGRPLVLDETLGSPGLPTSGFSMAYAQDLGRIVTVLGADRLVDPDILIYDNVDHTFRIFGGQANFATTSTYGYSDFGYAGVPTSLLPTVGGGRYNIMSAGLLEYNATVGLPADGIFASGELWINFATGTVIGILRGSDSLGNTDVDLGLEDAFIYGMLTSGNDFSSLSFVSAGSESLVLGARPIGNLFMDSARGLGFTIEEWAEDYVTGSTLGFLRLVTAGTGDVSSTPWPLNDVRLTGKVKGIEEYFQATDGTLSDLDVIFGPLAIDLTSAGGMSASSYLSSVFGGDTLSNVQATAGVAVSDYVFGSLLDNGITPSSGRMPPGALFTEYPPFYNVPTLASLDVDHTVAWGRILLPGVDPNNGIEALWVATSLPAYDMTVSPPPTQPAFYQGKMRVMQAALPDGVQADDLLGTAEVLVDFDSKIWRGKLSFKKLVSASSSSDPTFTSSEILVGGPIDSAGTLTLAPSGFLPVTLDGTAVAASGIEMDFFGSSIPDLLLGDWYVDISGQSDLYTGVVVAEPASGGTILSGAYLGGPSSSRSLGPMVAVNNGGTVWGWASASQADGTLIPLVPFDSTMPAPAFGYWSELVSKPFSFTDTYWTGGNAFVGERHATSIGDFAYWLVPPTSYTTASGVSEQFQMFAALGTTPTGLPSSAASEVWKFAGSGLEMYGDAVSSGAYVLPSLSGAVNWAAKKFIAVFEPTSASGAQPVERIFFVADIDPTKLDNPLLNLTPLGTSACPYTPGTDVVSLVQGTSRGWFAGSYAQAMVLQLDGQFFNLASDLSTGGATFRILAAGLTSGSSVAAGTGTAVLEGFVTGVAENMLDPGSGRMEFMNANVGGLTMTINRDAGTVTGTLGAVDQATVTTASNSLDLNVGGTGRASAFIDDGLFIAQIGDDSGGGVSIAGSATTLKDSSGNYLVTARPSEQGAAYATWGYWETAWTDPSSGAPYHLQQPGSYWVAGERTPDTVIQDLINTQVTAVYQGRATGVRIDTANPSLPVQKLPTGTLDLTFDFGATSVTGSIVFPADSAIGFAGKTLPVGGGTGAVTTSGFSAQVTDAATSAVNGAFYGPNAGSVGGNFRAEYSGERYMGIFVGDKQ